MTSHSEANVARQIVDLCRWISEGSIIHIGMGMSLTRDLAFDSMKLMQFFSGTEELYSSIALEDWFIEHSSSGRDTIGSVVQYIAATLPLVAAEQSDARRRATAHPTFVNPSSSASKQVLDREPVRTRCSMDGTTNDRLRVNSLSIRCGVRERLSKKLSIARPQCSRRMKNSQSL